MNEFYRGKWWKARKSFTVSSVYIPVVGGGVGAGVVGFGFPFLVHLILHFPPLETFLASVITWMEKSPVTFLLAYLPFLLQSLRKKTL